MSFSVRQRDKINVPANPLFFGVKLAMTVSKLSFELRAVICKAASHLTGFQRRLFVAQVAIEYSQASPPQWAFCCWQTTRTVRNRMRTSNHRDH